MEETIGRDQKAQVPALRECRVVALPEPFSLRHIKMVVPEGTSITQMLRKAGIPEEAEARVCVGGFNVPKDLWPYFYPKHGQIITIRVLPSGGGDSGKSVLAVVIAVAAIALSFLVPGGWGPMIGGPKGVGLYTLLARTGIVFAAALATNALIAPSLLKSSKSLTDSPSYDITGTRNQLLPYNKVPRIYGRKRVFPLYLAKPFTEVEGDDQYFRAIFIVGYGPLQLSDFRIGETPLEQYDGVEWVINREWSAPPSQDQEVYTRLTFDGSNDKATIQHDTQYAWEAAYGDELKFTAEARFRIEAFPDEYAPVLNKGEKIMLWVNQDRTIEAWIALTRKMGRRDESVWLKMKTAALVQENVDHHIAVVLGSYNSTGGSYRGLSAKIYLDGEVVKEQAVNDSNLYAFDNSSSDIRVGTNADESYYFDGLIWDIRLWSVARTAEQIYTYFKEAIDGTESGLLGWWEATTDDGAILTDKSSYANDGAISGATYETYGEILADLWSSTVDEENPQILVSHEAGWLQRRTEPNTDEISVDITLPGGLYHVTADGEYKTLSVQVVLQYSPAGADEWTTVKTWDIEAMTKKALRFSKRWRVKRGQYDIRISRTTEDQDDEHSSRLIDLVYWTAYRSIKHETPIGKDGFCLFFLRIKASEQLNGIVDQLNMIAESILPVYDGTNWSEQATRLAAWEYVDTLCGSAAKNPVDRSRLDLTTLKEWADANEAEGRYCDAVIDFKTTSSQVRHDICARGRASFHFRDGLYSVIRDVEQETPVQLFTPRNSWGFKGAKSFPKVPHALRVKYDGEYQTEERIVYYDGYDATNATFYEELQLFGCTDPDQAYKDGRYYLKNLVLRPEVYELYTDVENIRCDRGDLVLVNHDIPLWGSGSARIKSRTEAGGNLTHITVDDAMTMVAGKSYCVRVRLSDGTIILKNIVTDPGEQTDLEFETALTPAEDWPAVGDLLGFGELDSETTACLVKSIMPLNDLSAKLTLVDYAPALFEADEAEIPEYDPNITPPVDPVIQVPERPAIIRVISDESVLIRGNDGTLISQIVLMIGADPHRGYSNAAEHYQTQYQYSGFQDHWTDAPTAVANAGRVEIPYVADGMAYDIRVRAVARAGAVSEWSYIRDHTVIGKTSPPNDVEAVFLNGSIITWTYPYKELDFAGYRLKYHPGENTSWENAHALHQGLLPTEKFEFQGLEPGTYTLLVKAVDVIGTESASAASIVINWVGPGNDDKYINVYPWDLIAQILFYISLGRDPDYYLENCSIVDVGGVDKILADENTVLGSPLLELDSEYESLDGIDPAFSWTLVGDTRYKTAAVTPLSSGETGGFELTTRWGILCDITVESAETWRLEYRLIPETAIWAGTQNEYPWKPWPGFVTNDLGEDAYIYLRLVMIGGQTRGIVSAWTLEYYQIIIKEHLNDVSIDAAGTRLSLTESYQTILNVQLTLVDDGGDAVSAKVMDKDETNGPLIQCFDSDGVACDGTVDVEIRGI